MNHLKKLGKILMGGVAGSTITMSGPLTPMGIPEKFYTLEELSYQTTAPEQTPASGEWEFTWVDAKGFVLRPKSGTTAGYRPVPLRQAVYRTIVEN